MRRARSALADRCRAARRRFRRPGRRPGTAGRTHRRCGCGSSALKLRPPSLSPTTQIELGRWSTGGGAGAAGARFVHGEARFVHGEARIAHGGVQFAHGGARIAALFLRGGQPRHHSERPEHVAGGLEPGEVDGGEPAGGQDFPDEVDPGAWRWIPAEAFLRWPSPTLLPPRRSPSPLLPPGARTLGGWAWALGPTPRPSVAEFATSARNSGHKCFRCFTGRRSGHRCSSFFLHMLLHSFWRIVSRSRCG
ncbi:unnamed protein product [Urochloa humidicola]